MKYYFSSQDGYTIIELLVVFSVMSIIAISSIIGFNSYNNTQKQKTAAQEIRTVLQYTQASTQSQVKPTACGVNGLVGYKFILCTAGGTCLIPGYTYEVDVVCGAQTYAVKDGKVASGVGFANVTQSTYMFNALTSTATSGSFDVTASGQSNITVSVTQTGVVK